jgi:hypothetical protein
LVCLLLEGRSPPPLFDASCFRSLPSLLLFYCTSSLFSLRFAPHCLLPLYMLLPLIHLRPSAPARSNPSISTRLCGPSAPFHIPLAVPALIRNSLSLPPTASQLAPLSLPRSPKAFPDDDVFPSRSPAVCFVRSHPPHTARKPLQLMSTSAPPKPTFLSLGNLPPRQTSFAENGRQVRPSPSNACSVSIVRGSISPRP